MLLILLSSDNSEGLTKMIYTLYAVVFSLPLTNIISIFFTFSLLWYISMLDICAWDSKILKYCCCFFLFTFTFVIHCLKL